MPRTSPRFSIDSAARRLAGALLFISKPSRSWSPSVDPILRNFLQPLSKPLKASLVAAVIDPHLLHHHTLASGLFHWAELQPNFSHTAQTYHSLLKSLSLSRQPQLIPPLLKTARGHQVPLYSSSYQIAISSLLLLGKSIEAAELIDSATRSGDEELPASLYNSLLAGLSSDGFLEVARKLLGRMLRRGIIPSGVDFGVFMGQIKTLLNHPEKLLERQTELKTLLEENEAPEKVVDDESSVATNDWSGDFEWNSRAEDIRFNVFGIPSYRTNQREIINAVMSGKDVLVIMAAGGGKSLCYQLPALLRDGIALVVSPLLSLIQDQVMGLTTLGIPAYMLTSTTSEENEKLIYEALEKGEIELKVLYVTPEKISKSKRFMSTLEKCHHGERLSLIAIDEAHCCSQWGHDFRPDYKNLGILKIQFPNVPLIALTATATYKVQIDLMEMLHIPKCVKFVSTVNRPNLFYRVREKSSVGKIVIDEIAAFIKGSYSKNDSGIIYCFSRKECEQVAEEMRKSGISANHYHANMRVAAREKVHLLWSTNKLQGVVGTVAFGMGINKPDVRFVIHHSLSKSMETYFQESGRAGRDGLPSDCVLYYRPGDVPRQISMVFYENDGLQNLYDIVRYCQSKRKCRREAFSQHFGEPVQDCNGMCDNCAQEADDVKELDATYHAKVIVSLLHEMQEKDQRATMLQLVERFKLKIKALGRSTQPVSDLKKKEIEQLIVQLLLEHVLKEEFQHKAYATNLYIALGSLWKLVLEGRKQVMLEVYTRRQRNGMTKKRNRLSGLEVKLDELREELSSNNAGILPHAILSSQQISTLSSQRPTSMSHLEKLIGKVKTEKYGKRIIEATQKYLVPELADNDVPVAAKGSKQGGNKKRKNKLLVVVESSEDEQ